jgi:hypothetical protein
VTTARPAASAACARTIRLPVAGAGISQISKPSASVVPLQRSPARVVS